MNPFEMKTDGKVCPKCGGTNTHDHWSCPDDHGLVIIHNWRCKDCGWDDAAMTNGDKIRKMSDEELIPFVLRATLCIVCSMNDDCDRQEEKCRSAIRGWLREEAKDE